MKDLIDTNSESGFPSISQALIHTPSNFPGLYSMPMLLKISLILLNVIYFFFLPQHDDVFLG